MERNMILSMCWRMSHKCRDLGQTAMTLQTISVLIFKHTCMLLSKIEQPKKTGNRLSMIEKIVDWDVNHKHKHNHLLWLRCECIIFTVLKNERFAIT